jgi:hypothetical protein
LQQEQRSAGGCIMRAQSGACKFAAAREILCFGFYTGRVGA